MAHQPRFYTEAQMLLTFIVEYHAENGVYPTLREGIIHFKEQGVDPKDGSGLGLRSLCTYHDRFDHLVKTGCIQRVAPGSPRYSIIRTVL